MFATLHPPYTSKFVTCNFSIDLLIKILAISISIQLREILTQLSYLGKSRDFLSGDTKPVWNWNWNIFIDVIWIEIKANINIQRSFQIYIVLPNNNFKLLSLFSFQFALFNVHKSWQCNLDTYTTFRWPTCPDKFTFPWTFPPKVDRAWYTTMVTSPETWVFNGIVTFPSSTEKPLILSYSCDVVNTLSSPMYTSTNGLQPFLRNR